MGNSTTKKGNFVAILAMIFLFAMIAFVTNLCSPMAVILKNNFSVSDTIAAAGDPALCRGDRVCAPLLYYAVRLLGCLPFPPLIQV